MSLFPGTRGYNISIRGPQPLVPRHLFLGRKVMTNLDSIFKNRDKITLPTKVRLVKAMVVVYGCESWAVKKAEH